MNSGESLHPLLTRWLLGVFVAVAILVPLVAPSTTDRVAARWFALAAVAGVIAVCLRRPSFPRAHATFVIVMSGLGLWYFVTMSWALVPTGSLVEGSRFLAATLLFVAAWVAGEDRRSRWVLMALVLATCAAVVGAVLVQAADQLSDRRVAGWLGYWNATALCAIIVGLACVRGLVNRRLALRIACPTLAIAAGAVLGVTLSRGALLAYIAGALWMIAAAESQSRFRVAVSSAVVLVLFGVGIAAVGVFAGWQWLLADAVATLLVVTVHRVHWQAPKIVLPDMRGRWALATVVLVALGLFVAVTATGSSRNIDAAIDDFMVAPVADARDPRRFTAIGNQARLVWWREATREWTNRPVTGLGGQAFSMRRQADVQEFLPASRPHHFGLQLALEGGVIALLLAMIAGGALLRAMWSSRDAPLATLAAAIVVAFTVQTVSDWTWSFPFLLAIASVAAGIACGSGRRVVAAGNTRPGENWPLLLGIAALCLVPAIGFGLRAAANSAAISGDQSRAQALGSASRALLPAARVERCTPVDGRPSAGCLQENR